MKFTRELFEAVFRKHEQPKVPLSRRIGPEGIAAVESELPDASVDQLEHALETLRAEGKTPPYKLELDASDWQNEGIRNWCRKQEGLEVRVHRADGKIRRVL